MPSRIGLDTQLVVSKDQVSTEMADGQLVILSVQSGQYYSLNRTGAQIWGIIQEPHTVRDIRDQVLSQHEALDPDRCTNDTLALLTQLVEARLVEVVTY